MENLKRNTLACLGLALALLLGSGPGARGEEFRFDVAEFAKKPYQLGGYLELRPVLFGLDRDGALYRLRFFDRDEGDTTAEFNGRLQLEGRLEKGAASLFVRANGDYLDSYLGESLEATLYDGYLSLKPSPVLTFEAGKKSLRWGTGYAWNPVAFLDRPKDPDDPEQNREGYVVATVEVIRSLAGPLRTFALAPVLLPVEGDINDDFGASDHLNVGGKIYGLLYDTDLDLFLLTGGSRSDRFGLDFARNLTSSFEVHGEFAYLREVRLPVVDQAGNVTWRKEAAENWLLGLRYLSPAETTWIAEYYHNGAGYSREEMENFFTLANLGYQVFQTSGDPGLLQKAKSLAEGGYGRLNPMRDYLYLRVSQKEPFDLLYLTPAATAIVNLNDRSFTLSPEILYTAVTNLELRLKGSWLSGSALSEYGEKQNDWRLELRLRYYL
jgi:hypothetical protein